MEGVGATMSLPMLDDMTNYPLVFHSLDAQNGKLVFSISTQPSATPDKPIHIVTAVALLKELSDSLGPSRESLFRYHRLPIIGCETLEHMGILILNFLLVKPLPDPRYDSPPFL